MSAAQVNVVSQETVVQDGDTNLPTKQVYVENTNNAHDGELSKGVVINLPSSQAFNADAPPYYLPATVTRDGFQVKITPKLNIASYYHFALVMPVHAPLVTISSLKSGTHAVCRTGPVNVNVAPFNTEKTSTLTGCGLQFQKTFKLFAYIESAGANNDGAIYGPIDVVLGNSETFLTKPYMSVSPTTGGITAKFQNTQTSGKLWALITTDANRAATNSASVVKSFATAVTSNVNCRKSDVAYAVTK